LYANRAHRAGIEGVDIEALVAAGRALLEVRPRTAKELGELLRERWPDPASLARAIRHLVPLVQVPPRGIWGKSGRAAHYGSLQTGLAFLPATLVLGALSYSAAAKVVNRFGVKPMLVVGMALLVSSLLLFARAPVGGSFLVDVLPGMLLLGFGASFAFLTVILASVSGVPERDAGLASGLVNTAHQLGGALGLAVLASVAAPGPRVSPALGSSQRPPSTEATKPLSS
jgi:hypothetical protein